MGVRVASLPASVLHAKTGGPESLLEWQLHFGQLRRLKADEAAQAVLYLASEDASNITGTEIVVDGGATGAPACRAA